MVIIILERVTPGLRGELTRWMLELKAGVFLGSLSALVRDRLWELVCKGVKKGAGLMVYRTNNEQGFDFKFWGVTDRLVEDFDGLNLARFPR